MLQQLLVSALAAYFAFTCLRLVLPCRIAPRAAPVIAVYFAWEMLNTPHHWIVSVLACAALMPLIHRLAGGGEPEPWKFDDLLGSILGIMHRPQSKPEARRRIPAL